MDLDVMCWDGDIQAVEDAGDGQDCIRTTIDRL